MILSSHKYACTNECYRELLASFYIISAAADLELTLIAAVYLADMKVSIRNRLALCNSHIHRRRRLL